MNILNYVLMISFVKGFIEKDLLLYNSYLLLENKILRSKLRKRIPLNDFERKQLAICAKHISPLELSRIATVAKVETIRGWWRNLVKEKFNYSRRRKKVGRPPIMKIVRSLIFTFAIENPSWGCKRIQGSLKEVGYNISHTTINNTLKENGLNPFPGRRADSSWHKFIKSHMEVIWATDFFTYEVLSIFGPITYYVLFFIHLETREVKLGGINSNPD